jgi:hypothetical protein
MANQMMRRLAMFDAASGSEMLENIFIELEKAATAPMGQGGVGLPPALYAAYERLKRYEVNSREVYDNFYNTLAGAYSCTCDTFKQKRICAHIKRVQEDKK